MMIDPGQMNTTALAFLGDSIYEQYIRRRLILEGRIFNNADRMHKEAVCFVRASAQCIAIKAMLDSLSDDERSLVLRARNHKTSTKPKNAGAVEYKWATAFEALIAYTSLSGNEKRTEELMDTAFTVIKENENEQSR